MKRPLSPPSFPALFGKYRESLSEILGRGIGPTVGGSYVPWDKLRHLNPPAGLGHEQWWLGIKLARTAFRRFLPLTDAANRPFFVVLTPQVLEGLHQIDNLAAGRIAMPEPVVNPATRERFLIRSLVEEAITSSQLEGASTTRQKAMEMFRSGRQPANKSEQMIFNNLRGMEFIRTHRRDPLTPQLVLSIHRELTRGTLSSDAVGRLQSPDEERVRVVSNTTGDVLHAPPPAEMLPLRMKRMCRFANAQGETEFLHPVIRAILLHLWLGYDHPFEDGNGRAARALFYWSMLHEGYWLFEFISISAILRRASAQYGRSYLYTETDENDATYFVTYQLDAILRALKALERYLETKLRQIAVAEQILKDSGSFNHRQLALLSHALRNPNAEYTIHSHKVSQGIAYATARADLLDLSARGFLEERRIGKASHFFVGKRLFERIDLNARRRSEEQPP